MGQTLFEVSITHIEWFVSFSTTLAPDDCGASVRSRVPVYLSTLPLCFLWFHSANLMSALQLTHQM